ncbi:MAG: nuclear transport factor 2 family protein [Cognaticolwellia sp.]
MYKTMLAFLFFSCMAVATEPEHSELDQVLDSFHQAAADANYQQYMGLFAKDGIFLGTDSTERWTKAEFSAFVQPYFSQGRGWLYTPIERHISSTPARNIVFFDELLESKSYGRCRGSGVLTKTAHGWKILQYNLSIPLPNAIASDVTATIKAYRATQPNNKQ